MPILWFIALLMDILFFIMSYRENRISNNGISKSLIGLSICVGGWIFCELMIQLVIRDSTVLFFHEIKYIFVLSIPGILYALAHYIRYQKREPMVYFAIRCAFIVPFIVLVATNEAHHLFRESISVDRTFMTIVKTQNNIVYYLIMFYVYLIVLYAVYNMIQHHFALSKIYRGRIRIIILGGVLAMFTNIGFQVSQYFWSFDIDFTALAFGVVSWMFYYGFYIYDSKEIPRLVKDFILDDLGIGLVFLDNENVIHYVNYLFEVVTKTDEKDMLGQHMNQLPKDIYEIIIKTDTSRQIMTYRYTTDRIFVYDVAVIDMLDDKNRVIGKLVSFKDVSDIEMANLNQKYANQVLNN